MIRMWFGNQSTWENLVSKPGLLSGSTRTVVVEGPWADSNSAFSRCHLSPGSRVYQQGELVVRWVVSGHSSGPFRG